MKAAAGEAFTIMQFFVSQPTDSDLREGETNSPPQDIPVPGAARNLPFPPVIDPEVLPLRSQRHMPNSIATLRFRLARTLAHALCRDVLALRTDAAEGRRAE